MNQAISNAMLFNIVIIFVIILIAFFLGSLSYSKAFKVNNRIVEEIEKFGEESNGNQDTINKAYYNAGENILSWLNYGDAGNGTGIGYRQVRNGVRTCPDDKVKKEAPNAVNVTTDYKHTSGNINPYEYCVYRIEKCENSTKKTGCYTYYRVITYMYFDLPIIDNLIKIPVTGETMGFQTRNN